jgi:hypothetical protein
MAQEQHTPRRIARVAIVLDRSGSMEACRDATIGGFNEYIASIRQTVEREELPTRVTLTTFNGEVEVHYVDAPAGRLKPLTRRTYVPDGTTAMLDAVGETIERLQESDSDQDVEDLPLSRGGRGGRGVRGPVSHLVCVISDGYENASRRYTYPDLAERIQQLTATGSWTFTYLGSNQDLSRISHDLHIPAGNVAAYAATPAGTDSAWKTHQESTSRHLSSAATGAPPPTTFYGGEEDADITEKRT